MFAPPDRRVRESVRRAPSVFRPCRRRTASRRCARPWRLHPRYDCGLVAAGGFPRAVVRAPRPCDETSSRLSRASRPISSVHRQSSPRSASRSGRARVPRSDWRHSTPAAQSGCLAAESVRERKSRALRQRPRDCPSFVDAAPRAGARFLRKYKPPSADARTRRRAPVAYAGTEVPAVGHGRASGEHQVRCHARVDTRIHAAAGVPAGCSYSPRECECSADGSSATHGFGP